MLSKLIRTSALTLVMLVVFAQAQQFAWSTARIENATTSRLDDVVILVEDMARRIGSLPPHRARFVRLPKRGDATLKVLFVGGGQQREGCSEYVEGQMYHVRIRVSDPFVVTCTTELGLSMKRLMLLEML